jgi:hypothetical protein
MFSQFQTEGMRLIEFWDHRFHGTSTMMATVMVINDPDVTQAFRHFLRSLFETNGTRLSDNAGDDILDENSPSTLAILDMLTPDRPTFAQVIKTELDVDIVTYVSYYSYYNSNKTIFNQLVELATRIDSENR